MTRRWHKWANPRGSRGQARDAAWASEPAPATRRAFLGGAASLVALPWLPSLLPAGAARADAPTPPARALFYFVPNGMQPHAWTPQGQGASWTLSPILQPLARFQQDVTVISGLHNHAAKRPVFGGTHGRGTASALTSASVKDTSGLDVENGDSADQILAHALGDRTLLPSVQVGGPQPLRPHVPTEGVSTLYYGSISWWQNAPQPNLARPPALFDRLFQGLDSDADVFAAARRRALRASILDDVQADAAKLSGLLSSEDATTLEAYLTGIRELERRVDAVWACDALPARPEDIQRTWEEEQRLLKDLMINALRCDVTRFATYMEGGGGSGRTYPFTTLTAEHHEISHHNEDPIALADYQAICVVLMERFAELLDGLAAVQEADGSRLLDHTAVYFTSDVSDGNLHNYEDMRVVVAGGAALGLRTGEHLVVPDEPPVGAALLSIMQAAGLRATRLGDADSPLTQLFR